MNWNCICIEPLDTRFIELKNNRKCYVDNGLVSSHAGIEKDFTCDDTVSGIIDEISCNYLSKQNIIKKTTTTLEAILDKFNAPSIIDYLSLDVEGHEYDILSTFPFHKYKFRCITVEHNLPHCGPFNRMRIRKILEMNGYTFIKGNDNVHNWAHDQPIDDFYVLSNS